MKEFTIMETFRRPVTARILANVTLFFFTFVFHLSPAAWAVAQEIENTPEPIVLTGTPAQKMNQGLLKLHEMAAKKQAKIAQRVMEEKGLVTDVLDFFGLSQPALEEIGDLLTLANLLAEQHGQALADFSQVEADLIAKDLPEIILQRHRDTVAQYQASYDDMQAKIQAVLRSTDLDAQKVAVDALDDTMGKHKLKKTHQKTDPNKLPWGTPDASKTRKPGETPDVLSSLTGIPNHPQPILLAANVVTPEMLNQAGGPVAEDLTETPDIQLTDAIRAKALELNDDPVQIYNWVRNNIEFIPSYGSIQGADYTLQHGKGNAFDTASLLIGLLRAANIPARYAYGTVEIPVEKVMNWVGGVDVPEAAQQLLGQGGIPNVALINGGKITHIRLETVWAEAWVDYFPSRAAKHVVGDQWIPLDASFKQYEFTEGQDLETNVPFDAQGLVDEITQSATIDETQGFVQGVDQAAIETALTNYQQQIEDYINNQNPDATVGEVLGTQRVIMQEYQQLAAGLPYKLVTRTHNYSELPNNLRHKFRYTLGTEYYGLENSRLITFEQSLPELAGKKHALSFRPSSQADEDLINSYLPEHDADTGEIDPSQLPNSLPGYLINLTAEFSQNGEVIHSVAAGTMGGELYETLALWSPSEGWVQAVNHPTAGEYRAIGLDLQGANPEEAERLQTNIETTQAVFNSGDLVQIDALGKNEAIGDLLYSAIYSYLIINDIEDQKQAKSSEIVNYRLPSYGLFSTSLQTSYFFGVPRNVSFDGMFMDVDRLAVQGVANDNDREKRVNFVKTSGVRASALEHLVPEQVFSTEQNRSEGISAVKALAIASAEGQRIWTITRDNLSSALAAINLDSDIENDIRNAVLAGKVATAHEQPISFAGGTNTGYLLIDPETGAGAYLISGGLSGGFLVVFALFAFVIIAGLFAATGWGLVAAAWAAINFGFWVNSIKNAQNAQQFNQANAVAGLALSLSFLPLASLGAEGVALLIIAESFIFMLALAFM